MQSRLIGGAVGALVGASVTPLVGGFGLQPPFGLIACAFTGCVIGWVATILLDVFRNDQA